MSVNPAVVLCIVLAVGVWLVVIYSRVKAWRTVAERVTRVEKLPVCEARGQVPDGEAVVVGEVVPVGDTLTSPLHKVPCVYFGFSVSEKETRVELRRGKFRRRVVWATRVSDSGAVAAFVGDGDVRIDLPFAGGPQIELKSDTRRRTGLFRSLDENLRDTLQIGYGFDPTGLVFNKNLHIDERVLEPGDRVTLIGLFKTGPDGRTRMAPLRNSGGDWLISDRTPEGVVARRRRAATFALLGVLAWFVVPLAMLVVVAMLRRGG